MTSTQTFERDDVVAYRDSGEEFKHWGHTNGRYRVENSDAIALSSCPMVTLTCLNENPTRATPCYTHKLAGLGVTHCDYRMCHRRNCVCCYPQDNDMTYEQDFAKRCEKIRENVTDWTPPAAKRMEMDREYESALDKQVAGSHYKDQGIQPIEVTFKRHGYAGAKIALSLKVDKYLTRDKDDEIEQLDKAIHCIELMKQFYNMENS